MLSKTLGLFLTLLISATLAVAGETPATGSQNGELQPAPTAAPEPPPAEAAATVVDLPRIGPSTVEETCTTPVFSTAEAGASCGGAVCGKLEYCCNPSCSICVPFGMSCTQQSCN